MKKRILALIAVITLSTLIAGSVTSAQDEDQDRPPRQRVPDFQQDISVNYMLVDVIVTDGDGNYIRNLTKEDFELFEEGKRQEIISLDEYKMGSPAEMTPETLAEGDLIVDQPPRNIVIFVDLFFSTPYGIKRAIDVTEDFVLERIQPGDRVMVLTYFESIQVIQPFTSDKVKVVQALQRSGLVSGTRNAQLAAISGNSFPLRSSLGNEISLDDVMGEADQTLNTSRMTGQNSVRNYLDSLEMLAEVVRQIRGRKTLIMLSGGPDYNLIDPIEQNFSGGGPNQRRQQGQPNMLATGNTMLTSLLPDYRDTLRELNNSSTSVYTINTSGLEAIGDAGVRQTERDPLSDGVAMGSNRQDIWNRQEFLSSIAAETGGRAYANTNNLRGLLDKVEVDISNYYILGYRSNFDPEDPEYRDIDVRVKLPGAKVLHRRGFRTPVSFAAMDKTQRDMHLIEGLQSGVQINQLKADATAHMFNLTADDLRATFSVNIPVEELTPIDGSTYELQVLAANLDESNNIVNSSHKRVRITPADKELVTEEGIRLVETLDAHYGLNKMRVAIRDNATGKLSYFFYNTNPPAPEEGEILLSLPVFYMEGSQQRISDIASLDVKEEENWNEGESGADLMVHPQHGAVFPRLVPTYTNGETVHFFTRVTDTTRQQPDANSLQYVVAAAKTPADTTAQPEFYRVKTDSLELVPYRSGLGMALTGSFEIKGWEPGWYEIMVLVQDAETQQRATSLVQLLVTE